MNQFNYTEARKARLTLGLSQAQVAKDLVSQSSGLLKLDKSKISRFERGDIALDDITIQAIKVYLTNKLAETLPETKIENDEEIEELDDDGTREEGRNGGSGKNSFNGGVTDDHIVSDSGRVSKGRISTLKVEPGKNISDMLRFNDDLDELTKSLLIEQYFVLSEQLEKAVDSEVKKGFFGDFTEQTQDDARACVYTMAGMLNIIKALQGNAVFPIEDSEEAILPKDSVLSVVQANWYSFTGQGPLTQGIA